MTTIDAFAAGAAEDGATSGQSRAAREETKMKSEAISRDAPRIRSRGMDALEYSAITLVTYPAFLAVVLMRRIVGRAQAQTGRAFARRSVFGEAKELARSSIAMTFMG